MIESDSTVDLGARQIKRRGNKRDRRLRHAAESLLQLVQDGKSSAWTMLVGRDDLLRSLRVPCLIYRHIVAADASIPCKMKNEPREINKAEPLADRNC